MQPNSKYHVQTSLRFNVTNDIYMKNLGSNPLILQNACVLLQYELRFLYIDLTITTMC